MIMMMSFKGQSSERTPSSLFSKYKRKSVKMMRVIMN